MSLARKLIAGSALALITGCSDTIFESKDLEGAKVTLERGKNENGYVCTYAGNSRTCINIVSYTMTVSEKGGCKYTLEANTEGAVYYSKKECDKAAPDKIKKPQEVFDHYIALIKEPLRK